MIFISNIQFLQVKEQNLASENNSSFRFFQRRISVHSNYRKQSFQCQTVSNENIGCIEINLFSIPQKPKTGSGSLESIDDVFRSVFDVYFSLGFAKDERFTRNKARKSKALVPRVRFFLFIVYLLWINIPIGDQK